MSKISGRNRLEKTPSLDTAPVGRFAPSPTGRMHAGNVFAALIAWLTVKQQDGRMVLRIEDIDEQRSKQEYIDLLFKDLELFGLLWDSGPVYQQNRKEAYEQAFEMLLSENHVYPCFCTRADIHAASAPHAGEHMVYTGVCKNLDRDDIHVKSLQRKPAFRLSVPDRLITFEDICQGHYQQNLKTECGDFIIRRSGGGFAYQFAVVLDDAFQNVSSVVRGCDLLSSTPQQIYLQKLLGFTQPSYSHIPLLVDRTGRRLSKRNVDASMDSLLLAHKTPEAILGYLAYLSGIVGSFEPLRAEDLLECAELSKLKGKQSILWESSR